MQEARQRPSWVAQPFKPHPFTRPPAIGYHCNLSVTAKPLPNCPRVLAFPVIPVPAQNRQDFTASYLFSLSKEPAQALAELRLLLKPRTLPSPYVTDPGEEGKQAVCILSVFYL